MSDYRIFEHWPSGFTLNEGRGSIADHEVGDILEVGIAFDVELETETLHRGDVRKFRFLGKWQTNEKPGYRCWRIRLEGPV
jgi:hypothetical protein